LDGLYDDGGANGRADRVEILHMWDGTDTGTNEAAVLKIVLPFSRPDSYRVPLSKATAKNVFTAIARELQPIVDHCFGSDRLRVEVTRVASGSLDIWLTLVTIGGGVYTFFKDYEDLRKNLLLFVEDVKQLGRQFEKHATDVYNNGVRTEHLWRQQERNKGRNRRISN
jgi:hypothetical protein